jgi:hypothetical protein
VVASAVLPNITVEFIPKFAPFSVIANAPTGTDVGDVLQSCTAGWVMVSVIVPNLVGNAVLVACTVTAFCIGTTIGDLYSPVVETVP